MSRAIRIVALALLMAVAAQGVWAAERTCPSFLASVVQVFVAIFEGSELGPLADPNGDEVNLGPLGDPNGDEATIGSATSHPGDDPELGPLADPNG